MPPQPAKLTIWQRLRLLGGRPRRLYLNLVRPGTVRASLARRTGECRRCGACCQMGLYCRHLTYESELSSCRRYTKYRTSNCRNFPIDERDLAERDRVFPHVPCGYRFRPSAHRQRRQMPQALAHGGRARGRGPSLTGGARRTIIPEAFGKLRPCARKRHSPAS